MPQVQCCYKNILETSTVTLSAGTEDANYPLYRLYDRDIGKIFKLTAAVTTEVKIDQGASGNLAVDRLLIPAGHNLNGMTLDIKWSDDDVTYTPAVTQWVQSGSGLINKNWTSITHRYWKFIITTPASIPQLMELFLTQSYTWEQNPQIPWGPFDDEFNAENDMDSGGHDRFLTFGNPKKQRVYSVYKCEDAQKTNIISLNDAWAAAKPFYIADHDSVWLYGKLRNPISIKEEDENESGGLYSFDFDFLEVLP